MQSINANLAELLSRPDNLAILRRLAEQPGQWISNPQLGWCIGGESRSARGSVYNLNDALVKAGVLEDITAMHNNKTLRIIKIDRVALRDLLAEVER